MARRNPTAGQQMDGMRVRATGGIGEAFKSVGGVPTSVPAPEAYQAMESGVVDTVAFAQHAHLSFGTINQATWWTANLNPGTVNCPVVVNIDAYEALSDEHQKVLLDTARRAHAAGALCLVDARSGKVLWGLQEATNHVGTDGMCADIDSRHAGSECHAVDIDRQRKYSKGWLFNATPTDC